MAKPIILITGADGQLGKEFRKLVSEFPDFNFQFAGKLELDITVESWVKDYFSLYHTTAVVNCAAYTNVERAEDEPELALLGNAAAPGFLADASRETGALLVHFSTDYVFDGTKSKAYLESDEVKPLNIYGESKLQGERLIDEKTERYFVIRTSWLYSAYGHNFFNTMMRLAKEKDELNVVNDQIASPTYAGDLATDVLKLLHKILIKQQHIEYGLYHYTESGEASWFDFAKEIVKQAELNVPVQSVKSGTFPVKAIRPMYSKMDNSKWIRNTGLVPCSWNEGLKRCLENKQRP